MNRRHLWQKQIVPMLNTIAFRCGPLLNLPVPWDNEAHALPVPFDDLTNYSDGLDFRTDAQGSARGILYRERERIQSEFGLYFDDFPGGIRWTMLPKLGMLWRYDEEQKRTESALKKTQEMTQQAIHASGGAVVERALFTAVDRSEEHTSELQSHVNLVCRLLL